MAGSADSSTAAPEANRELAWLVGIAGELEGSPEVTVTLRQGSLGFGAQVTVAGREAVGIGFDPGGALRDA
ncbi:MAG: hypothetical protein ACYCXW_14515, partial [Solirubrobacteraceae bacterium]